MPTIERARARGARHARTSLAAIADELREARLAAGMSQQHVASVAGLTQSRVSRTERCQRLPPRIDELARHCAALGLRLSLRAYPDASPVRDAAQLRLLARLRAQLGPGLRWRSEVPVGGEGDLRAWDVVLDARGAGAPEPAASVGIDAETRLRDIQALQRRVELKRRDSGVDIVALLLADTKHNRAVLRAYRTALTSTFPLDTAAVMSALRRGQIPRASGIVIL